MSVTDDYLSLRRVQKEAREEMWHILSHHPELQDEWDGETSFSTGGCFYLLRKLVEWEPE